MFVRILKQMRERVLARQYVMTLHAEEEMNDDGFTVYDVERGILAGRVMERQKDGETGQWKYLLHGQAVMGGEIAIVGKLSPAGKLVIITVYAP